MASKKTKAKRKNPLALRFSKRLKEVAAKKNLKMDAIVRLSPRLKFGTMTSWWNATRLPEPSSIVDLAKALEMDPLTLVKGVGLDGVTLMDIELIMKAEAPRAQPG